MGALWYFGQDAFFPYLNFNKESSHFRYLSKSLIDNATSDVKISSQWMSFVTLVMPILFGYQHNRLFSNYSVYFFYVSCTIQYNLWNAFRIYLTNRHMILLNLAQYGSWYKLSLPNTHKVSTEPNSINTPNSTNGNVSESQPQPQSQSQLASALALELENCSPWKYNHKYTCGDIVSVTVHGIFSNATNTTITNTTNTTTVYYELKSSSSCIPEADCICSGPEYKFVQSIYDCYLYIRKLCGYSQSQSQAQSTIHSFPLSSYMWCACHPVMYSVMSERSSTAYTLYGVLEWDRGPAVSSKILMSIITLITLCTITQAVMGFFVSKVSIVYSVYRVYNMYCVYYRIHYTTI